MKQIANERGGQCLSDLYINAHKKLLWECAEGHSWKAPAHRIKSGTWCPKCSDGLGERICREYFSQLFDKEFPKSYPKWLINKKGNQLELDGYCKSLCLAFEHQGEYHYSLNGHYIKSEKKLAKRKEDDQLKKELCAKKGITLIEVPEIPTKLPIKNIRFYLAKEHKKLGLALPNSFFTKKVNLKNAYLTHGSKAILNELKYFVKLKGGKCISDVYINARSKMIWECSEGHRWKSIPDNIKRGSWCPFCAGTVKGTIMKMKGIASKRGGKCLSKKYVDRWTKLSWECSIGHRWMAIPSNILKGKWCPVCAGNVMQSIEDMRELAKDRGGRCLSSAYLNANTKLIWECAEGHQWEATPHNVKRGTWCPRCGGTQRLSIKEMKAIAEERGGKCLSKEYINARTKLKWQCGECGHIWKAAPYSIKSGRWCPVCGIKKSSQTKKIL
jgi:hypothetical protein